MKKKRNLFQILAAAVAGIGFLAIIAVCILKFMPTSKRLSPQEYFGNVNENEAVVIIGDHIAEERALVLEGSVYISYPLVQNELNSRFYWDASEGILLFTTAEQIFEIPPNGTEYTVEGEVFDAGYDILKTTSSGMFLSAAFLEQYSDLKCQLYESPARVVVTFGSTPQTTAVMKKDTVVRILGGIKSPIITDVKEDKQVTVLEQLENWSQIRTEDGFIGYVKNSRLKDMQETVTDTLYQGPEYTSIHQEDKVNMVWHQIDYEGMNSNLKSDLSDVTGINVISPTWYFLSDNSGEIQSFADASYVKKAHKKGLQVWALISNFSPDVSTSALLASRQARQKVQNYLISQALELNFDGINIDFEGIAQEAGHDYVQFMRELSILCRKNQIVLSVDVPVPMDFSRHYDREELGIVCDYVIMMGYDEHYYGCETAGSVASMSFESTGIENMLTEVAPEKLISAIPFYSRVWYTQTLEDGSQKVTSELINMGPSQELLESLGVTSSYDEASGQQYGQWTDEDGRLCQIWLEDAQSVEKRAAMVVEYGLAGISAWVLGNEEPYVWDIISREIGQ